MKTLEKLLVAGFVIGLILNFSLIRGGAELIFITMSSLSCIYYPLGFLLLNGIRLRDIFKKSSYNSLSAANIVFAAVAGLGLSVVCIGSLFKLLTLMGADKMLTIGLAVTAAVFILSIATMRRNKSQTSKLIIWRTSIAGIVALTLLLISNLSIIQVQYRRHPAYIEAYSKYQANPTDTALIKLKELEYHRITLTPEQFRLYEKSLVTD
jgi:hypothetical protein